jgi:hypothetical protein
MTDLDFFGIAVRRRLLFNERTALPAKRAAG